MLLHKAVMQSLELGYLSTTGRVCRFKGPDCTAGMSVYSKSNQSRGCLTLDRSRSEFCPVTHLCSSLWSQLIFPRLKVLSPGHSAFLVSRYFLLALRMWDLLDFLAIFPSSFVGICICLCSLCCSLADTYLTSVLGIVMYSGNQQSYLTSLWRLLTDGRECWQLTTCRCFCGWCRQHHTGSSEALPSLRSKEKLLWGGDLGWPLKDVWMHFTSGGRFAVRSIVRLRGPSVERPWDCRSPVHLKDWKKADGR